MGTLHCGVAHISDLQYVQYALSSSPDTAIMHSVILLSLSQSLQYVLEH